MKKSILFLLLLASALMLKAQDQEPSWKTTLPRHDIQIGFGDPLLTGLTTGGIRIICCDGDYDYTFASEWFSPDVYTSCRFSTPAISASYRYRFAKWFWFGATTSYSGFYTMYKDRITGIKAGYSHTHLFSVMPSVRFSWLNKKHVTLYSGLSLGIGLIFDEAKDNTVHTLETEPMIAGQLSAVGIQAGGKWYGFAELGIGTLGFVQAGFGYHFNKENK